MLKVSWVHKCFLAHVKKVLLAAVKMTLYTKNTLVIKTSRARVFILLSFLRSHLLSQYKSLVDIIVYDRATQHRFAIIYNLLSVTFNTRLQVYTYGDSTEPVPSVCQLYAAANWLEREAWDLYGVFFKGHPDLRKILTDYGFNYHPLRKDFPLSGYKEVRYCEKEKRVIHCLVELPQAYRIFSFRKFYAFRLRVRTLPFQGKNVGSNPIRCKCSIL
jgi:NADH:ubiquinone oxidoreductase subunit C